MSRGVRLCSLVSRDVVSAGAVLVSRGVRLCSLMSRDMGVVWGCVRVT